MDRFVQYRSERERPSFSSTLLDSIYRSIDDDEEELVLHRETMRKKQSNCRVKATKGGFDDDEEERANLRRVCMIEKWMEKKVSDKVVVVQRKSRKDRESSLLNSSSTSSDSSYEAVYVAPSKSSGFATYRPKPIRTSGSIQKEEFKAFDNYHQQQNNKGGNFVKKTKSRTGDLKKPKQPISPGGRIVSFLNSLFTAGNSKKAKISSSAGDYYAKQSDTVPTSTCSSTTSFSRSCLSNSNTPSSRVKSSNDTKRSVRFHPISVIVDEDSQPCGHKSLHGHGSSLETVKSVRNSINEELRLRVMEKHRRVEEVARDLLRNYQNKVHVDSNNDNEDDDDDGASCASSDLFELDNLAAIGMDRYSEELPVYETTHFDTNRAIANGLMCN
ncbi:protein BIG GRAIN 1-like B [Cornus florida]|uniref:protein BIG GRAIN 1-like B n=1 Tax=Cornus florida TaxID=4283 RepID=UPI00289DD03C|nr:protein BIG GRAIN 1-like B [Cornus florida]